MLTGALVTLRAIAPADFDALYALDSELATWELRDPAPPTATDRAGWEERMRARLAKESDDVRFAVEAEGACVGRCGLMFTDPLARHAAVAVALIAEARGRGYGTDALGVLVAFAFARRNLRRLHLLVLARNAPAIASYRKLGFVEEGRRREHAWVDGGYEDDVIMGLLRDDWAATHGALAG